MSHDIFSPQIPRINHASGCLKLQKPLFRKYLLMKKHKLKQKLSKFAGSVGISKKKLWLYL